MVETKEVIVSAITFPLGEKRESERKENLEKKNPIYSSAFVENNALEETINPVRQNKITE